MNQNNLKKEEIERLWRDPNSRKGWGVLGVYYQPKDPRVIVPKHYGYGWTINFAHPSAIWHLLSAIFLVPLPGILTVALAMYLRLSIATTTILLIAVLSATIIFLCLRGKQLSSRYE
jgi:uncharacterized membrane protein